MVNTIQTNMINYVDGNGKIVFNEQIATIQVRSAADLALLTGFGTGTRAYLADESKLWIYGADGEWHLKANMNDTICLATFTTDDGVTTCDKTAEQLATAATDGKLILGLYTGALGTFKADTTTFAFDSVNTTDSELDHITIAWDDNDDEWDVTTTSYTLTPAE